MRVTQMAEVLNGVTKQVLGEEAVGDANFIEAVDKGREALGATDVESYTRKLMDRIGETMIVDRPFRSSAPDLLRRGSEFGSVLQKITFDLPDAEDNPSWALVDGQRYEQDIFTAPAVAAKYWNIKDTLQIKRSTVDDQVKSAFTSADTMASFLSGIMSYAQKALTIKGDAAIRGLLNVGIGETLFADGVTNNVTLASANSPRIIKLLSEYEDFTGNDTIDLSNAYATPEFIRYAVYRMWTIKDRLSGVSRIFNPGKQARFTSEDNLKFILNSDFARAADVYLQSDTFHDAYTRLPGSEVIPFWQGTGTNYDLNSTTAIDISIPTNGQRITVSGIIGCMFDRDALILGDLGLKTTTHYNANGDFLNTWFKWTVSPYYDANENFVIFALA